ncbi:hypothetical protein Glove_139g230 [Diversispora epigaea]|uniref:Ion transport domain-containing protein n=1 Tax=Diversispora epigaea TaxID=1348612 RepID=A0A397J203_9GLOM|nr:hypothetical protein Glove_139g230 [Diversispora epigaea]
MSEIYHSSFSNENDDDDKDSLGKLPTGESSRFSGNCIAISPDSKKIVTFSRERLELKLYDIEESGLIIPDFEFRYEVEHFSHSCWSMAISNCVGENERLIALSNFDARVFQFHGDNLDSDNKDRKHYLDSDNKDKKHDLEFGGDNQDPQTWVISTINKIKINTSFESIGGVIRFLDGDVNGNNYDEDGSPLKNKPVLIIVNASGIFKETIKRKRRKQRSSKIKQFEQIELPKQLSISILRNRDNLRSFKLLHSSIINNDFMVLSFKDRQQIIEMYSLITGDLKMLFKRHEFSVSSSNIIRGSPIFAISKNEKILAFCQKTTSITLYSMENGLEITTKQLESKIGIYKIVDINFIDADSKLLIILKEKEDRFRFISKNHQIFVIWDLFTTFENSIRQIDYSQTKKLKMDLAHRLMNSPGKMFAVRDSGDIFSVLDPDEDVASIRNPSDKAMTKIDITTTTSGHKIFNLDGKRSDKLAKDRIIIDDVEPWRPNKNYFRISVFLDSTKSTQLIISLNTIQVWKYRNANSIEKLDKRDRVLDYIWARNKVIDVQELRIGEREFELKVSIPSEFSTTKIMTIHWPNNVNVLEGACQALYVLGEKKNEYSITSFNNINKIKYLVECTQRLVRKYITRYGIFRLTSIRYPIMKYLIKSYQESLIKHILNKKINKKNSNIYIPRLHKWVDDNNRSTTEISKSDLYYAILCIKYREDSTVILKYLIDYYADNAKEYNNHGWLFTVSKAIPLLYDYRLNEFVQYLFKKPCFGLTEAYTPPLHIDPYDRKKGNNATSIHILEVKPRLASKFYDLLWSSLKKPFIRTKDVEPSNNDRKVYKVPLPYFTVYSYPRDPVPRDPEDNNEFVQYLFKKPCFGLTEAYTPPLHIDPYDRKKGNNATSIHILEVKPRLASKFYDLLWSSLKKPFIRTKDVEPSNNDRKVYKVPLPYFTVYSYPRDPVPRDPEDNSENYSKYFLFLFTLFRISLWPRRKIIKNIKEMSPFLRVIHEEKGYEFYKTPTIMAVLDFKWLAARRYFIRHFLMNIVYAISFGITVIPYSLKGETNAILIISFCIYLYTGWYLIVTKILHLSRKPYINIYSIFNLGPLLLPPLLILLRYFEVPGRFIHTVKSILRTLWGFFLVMLIVIFAFGHSMFVLLNYADDLQIPTYKINDTSNSDLFSNITIYQDIDKSSRLDNYYSNLLSSIEAVFFWTNGRWDQLDQWDNYAVDVISVLGSIVLVLIFQNILIAFMNTLFEKANEEGLAVAYSYRAKLVAEYEVLEKLFHSKEDDPRYIYYIPDPYIIDIWLRETKWDEVQELRFRGENLAASTDSDYSDYDDYDNNDHDNQDNSIEPSTIDKILFIDKEIFSFKVAKLNKKSQRNQKSNQKLLKNFSSNESLSDPGPTNVDDQLSVQERFNNMENAFNKRFNSQDTRFDELEQNLKTILKTLNDLNNSK